MDSDPANRKIHATLLEEPETVKKNARVQQMKTLQSLNQHK
jgi:hypothetical protein